MESNILIIVEGAKTEPQFFNQLSKVFNQKFEIYYLGTNIYTLYKRMKEIDFNGDLKSILIEIHPEKREMLSKKFAYTYLIFDCDVHHPKKDDKRSLDSIVMENFNKLSEMSEYFVDETDPSIGKLYINYPMMESFRDCDEFFDEQYSSASVAITELSTYKSRVAKRKICSIHVDQYTRSQFTLLILQNIYKLNKILFNLWDKFSYEEYQNYSNTKTILLKERELVEKNKTLSVINTSLFIITDFYGNRNGFYDSLKIEIAE